MAMPFSKLLFKAVDVVFEHPQNPNRLVKEYAEGLSFTKDIIFNEKDPTVTLDIVYKPQEGKKYPVIFEIHGGGFSAGDKKYRTTLCSWFAQNTGAFVVNVNYGLGREVLFPAPVIQLVNAFNWVIDNAEKYNLDTSKMLVTGDSAGGYYSSVLSVYPDCKPLQDACGVEMKGRFGASVLNCGIYDMEIAMGAKVAFNLTKDVCLDFAGIVPEDFPIYPYRDCVSPLYYVGKNYPKSYVIYAEKDIFCGGQGQALIQKLQELGVYEEHYASQKFLDNHTFSLVWILDAAKKANKKLLVFVNKFFNGEI